MLTKTFLTLVCGALASLSLFGQDPAAKKYNPRTMTAEEIDRAAAAEGRYDFDIAPEDGLIDAKGRAITAAELPGYLKDNSLVPSAFYFLWITPQSMPLNRLNVIDKLAAHGATTIVVRHRPKIDAEDRTPPPDPADPARLARAAALTPEQLAGLRAELEAIHKVDQDGRLQANAAEKQFGFNSPQRREIWDKVTLTDATNRARVTAILDEFGWLGPEQVGPQGNGALFLVIQHSNHAIQKRYLPMMQAAVRAGKARGRALALLEDRIALAEGRPQTYGSQIAQDRVTGKYYVRPMIDPDRVDERRAAVGLPPLAEYVKQWDIVWDVDAYKLQLPALTAALRPSL